MFIMRVVVVLFYFTKPRKKLEVDLTHVIKAEMMVAKKLKRNTGVVFTPY